MASRGKAKNWLRRHQLECRIAGSRGDWLQAPKGRKFNLRSGAQESVSRGQGTRCQEAALAVYPIGQEPIYQAGKVSFAGLGFLDVVSGHRGDFWLWACIDADTKLVFSHMIGARRNTTGTWFVQDVAKRVSGPVQIATDNNRSYACNIRGAFGYEGYSYGTNTKIFGEPSMTAYTKRKNGIPPIVTSERKPVIGSPDSASVTTSHIEQVFLSVRQECKRFHRLGLGNSKDLETHKLAIALHFGIYNYCRKHKTLGTTPAVAAGLEEARWSLEMTEAYWMPRREAEKQAKAAFRLAAEDVVFEMALA